MTSTNIPYINKFNARFTGIQTWEQLDELWETLKEKANAGWHIHQPSQPKDHPFDNKLKAISLLEKIKEIDQQLRQEHQEKYCGIVYVDNKQEPTYIKIFEPNNLGKVCGSSENPVLPGWIISLMEPMDIDGYFYPPKKDSWLSKLSKKLI
jgi:hypothetical protein